MFLSRDLRWGFLALFGRSFFHVWNLLEKYEKLHHLVRMPSGDHIGDPKRKMKTHLPSSVELKSAMNRHRKKWLSQKQKKKRTDQTVASFLFYSCPQDLVMIFQTSTPLFVQIWKTMTKSLEKKIENQTGKLS